MENSKKNFVDPSPPKHLIKKVRYRINLLHADDSLLEWYDFSLMNPVKTPTSKP